MVWSDNLETDKAVNRLSRFSGEDVHGPLFSQLIGGNLQMTGLCYKLTHNAVNVEFQSLKGVRSKTLTVDYFNEFDSQCGF